MIWYILLAIILVIITTLIIYARWNYGVLEGMGIPVVKPHFLLGSTWDINTKVGAEEDIKRFQTHGPIYGVYEGREPQIHICDAEIIKSIFIKDFEYFNGRRPFDFGSPFLNELPGFVPDPAKWKLLRSLMTPTLTPTKIKGMSTGMKDTLTEFIEDWKSQIRINDNQAINLDVKQAIFTMLTDMISRSMFNIKIAKGNDPNNHFAQIVKRLVRGGTDDVVSKSPEPFKPDVIFPYTLSFPFLKWFSKPIFNPNAGEDFQRTFKDILKNRRLTISNELSTKDYVESLIDWLDKLNTPEFKNVGITEQTILCQALTTFFGGQDQISTILPYMFYEVSKQPMEIEKRILDEVDGFLERHNGSIEYEHLNEFVYLLACINEALRFTAFFVRAERVCQKDWEGHGLKIPKGMTVIVPIWAANRNPKYFLQPEKFNPDRFLPENKNQLHSCALTSFGHGPRNCTGQRIAYDMMLMTAVYIYKDFRFRCNPENTNITLLPGSLVMARTNGICLDILPRN